MIFFQFDISNVEEREELDVDEYVVWGGGGGWS
jgi:hypothetical protein